MDSSPLVSVVIPVYNVEKFVEETIYSVLKQTYKNFEIIVVDDSSTDDTLKIVQKLSKKFHKINYYKIEHAGRPSVPRNFGISKAQGSLIAFLDGDDVWVNNKLEIQVNYLLNNPQLVFVYSMSVTFGTSIFSPHYEVLPLISKAARTKNDLLQKGNSITCSSVLVKKNALQAVNGFDEDPKLKVEDYDLWVRLSEIGPFLFIPLLHVYYRVHQSQFSADWEIKQERVNYLAKKRNWNLPPYRYYRNRGKFFLFARNSVHFLTFLWIKFIGWYRKK